MAAIGKTIVNDARGFQRRRIASTSPHAAAMNAYFVLSHGRAPIARPRAISIGVDTASGRQASATSTASAPGISGYTVKELKTNGPVIAAAAHANVAADDDPLMSRAHRHISVAASP